MNLEADIQAQGIAAEQQVSGYTFKVLSNGATFPGRIDPQPTIDPRLQLGSDPREYSVIYLLRSDYPDGLESQTRLSQLDQDTGAQIGIWMVVNRDDNPGDPLEMKLWATKVTPNDQ